MIRIYHVPLTRSLRVIWLCEELGLSYEAIPVDFSADYRMSEEWLRMNPVGKVPVLTDGDLTLFESGAMVQYLLDRYGKGALQPVHGTPEHASTCSGAGSPRPRSRDLWARSLIIVGSLRRPTSPRRLSRKCRIAPGSA